MSNSLESVARDAFIARFRGEPTALGLAPGRVELLGNHTDYNGGLVLATAIDRFTAVVGRATEGRTARVFSANFNEWDVFSSDFIDPSESGSWKRYVRGVTRAIMEKSGRLPSGFEAVIWGDVPLGAGLSSSASLEAAFAMFLNQLEQGRDSAQLDDLARMELAQTLQRVENEDVGVASGLLDQFSSLFGRADQALLLDCRSLEYERLPLGNPAPAIVVCDSKTSRKLADGMYNRRREECERVLNYFQQDPESKAFASLCDTPLETLQAAWNDLDPVGRRRARHVLTENIRVQEGAKSLKAGNLAELGHLMSASHRSSRDDFENSSDALNCLIEAAEAAPGHLGGKLTGAGWAGCTVHLVECEVIDVFTETLRTHSARHLGVEPEIHVCRAAEGAISKILRIEECPAQSSPLVK